MTKFSADREADIAKAIKYYNETPGVKNRRLQPSFSYLIDFQMQRYRGYRQSRTTSGHNIPCICEELPQTEPTCFYCLSGDELSG
jgi:hypothetical protein